MKTFCDLDLDTSYEVQKALDANFPRIARQLSSAEWGGLDVWKMQENNYEGVFVSIEGFDLILFRRVLNGENYESKFFIELDIRDLNPEKLETFIQATREVLK